jgi:hypothetical protein
VTRERMPSEAIWLRALDALQASATHVTADERSLAVGEALDGLTRSELVRVATALAELGADQVPRAMLTRRKDGDRAQRLAAMLEHLRLEIQWQRS